jgi:hypothetical protein
LAVAVQVEPETARVAGLETGSELALQNDFAENAERSTPNAEFRIQQLPQTSKIEHQTFYCSHLP